MAHKLNARYVLFAWTTYYPGGGWSDQHSVSDSLEELENLARGKQEDRDDDFQNWEIVDLTTFDVVREGGFTYNG